MKLRAAESVRSVAEPVDAAKPEKDKRVSSERAGYMELAGAKKDGDCEKVNVKGGVSKELGCCDLFEPESKETSEFRCGTCEHLKSPE